MSKFVTGLVLAITLFATPALAQRHMCSNDAVDRAQRLLAFHFGEQDARIYIEPEVTEVPSIRNPGGGGRLTVLEVWGYINKARYRMHFLYFPMGRECLLMGQEILEFANPN